MRLFPRSLTAAMSCPAPGTARSPGAHGALASPGAHGPPAGLQASPGDARTTRRRDARPRHARGHQTRCRRSGLQPLVERPKLAGEPIAQTVALLARPRLESGHLALEPGPALLELCNRRLDPIPGLSGRPLDPGVRLGHCLVGLGLGATNDLARRLLRLGNRQVGRALSEEQGPPKRLLGDRAATVDARARQGLRTGAGSGGGTDHGGEPRALWAHTWVTVERRGCRRQALGDSTRPRRCGRWLTLARTTCRLGPSASLGGAQSGEQLVERHRRAFEEVVDVIGVVAAQLLPELDAAQSLGSEVHLPIVASGPCAAADLA